MTKAIQPYKTSQPNYEVVVGKFCYPKPFAPGGVVSADAALPRPLIVGTDLTIAGSGANFTLTISATITNWPINIGGKVHFEGTGVDGIYTIVSRSGGTVVLNGPGQAVTTGYIWFDNMDQKITGVDTKFTKNVSPFQWIAIIDSALTPTVQVARVSKIVNDTELYVEKGFITAIASKCFLVVNGSIRGVSIETLGVGTIQGNAVASGKIMTFYQDSGLDPVYGDSTTKTFNILIQQ